MIPTARIGYGLPAAIRSSSPARPASSARAKASSRPVRSSTAGRRFNFPDTGLLAVLQRHRSGNPSMIADRENVINLHMGIPKHNGLRDDVQVLWSGSALANYFYRQSRRHRPGHQHQYYVGALQHGPARADLRSRDDRSGSDRQRLNSRPARSSRAARSNRSIGSGSDSAGRTRARTAFSERSAARRPTSPTPTTSHTTRRSARPIATSMTNIKAPGIYYAPGTPAHPYLGAIPLDRQLGQRQSNDTGVTKVQYTYALSQSAYLRAYGYTFYSDWLQVRSDHRDDRNGVPHVRGLREYDLITHTSGGALDFQDQINDQNLISLDGNYTTAGVMRFNNSTAFGSRFADRLHGEGSGRIHVLRQPGQRVVRRLRLRRALLEQQLLRR